MAEQTSPITQPKVLTFTFTEGGCQLDHPPGTTLNDLEAASGTLMCILLAQHLRKGGVFEAFTWRNQCFDAMTEFVNGFIAGKAQAAGFFSSALEEEEENWETAAEEEE